MSLRLAPRYAGPPSKGFWRRVNNIREPKARRRLYSLGCRLQELEGKVLRELYANTNAGKRREFLARKHA